MSELDTQWYALETDFIVDIKAIINNIRLQIFELYKNYYS